MVCSPDGDIDFFDIVTGVLQGNIALYLFVIYLDYVLWTSIDQIKIFFHIKKTRSKRYPAKTMIDTDYADDLALLANSPVLAESQLHSQEEAAEGIGPKVNANRIEFLF